MGEDGVEGGAELRSNMDCWERRCLLGLGLSSICTQVREGRGREGRGEEGKRNQGDGQGEKKRKRTDKREE